MHRKADTYDKTGLPSFFLEKSLVDGAQGRKDVAPENLDQSSQKGILDDVPG
jgi:hypothetical protein